MFHKMGFLRIVMSTSKWFNHVLSSNMWTDIHARGQNITIQ